MSENGVAICYFRGTEKPAKKRMRAWGVKTKHLSL
jgi:hypothetical protein